MLSLGFKAQLDQIWEGIKGPQDTIISDGLARPQVSHCQNCPASSCLHDGQSSFPEILLPAVKSDRPAVPVLVLQENPLQEQPRSLY